MSILSVALFAPTETRAEKFNDAQKTEINKMFEAYLLSNGELILESVNKYQAKIEEDDRKEASVKAGEFLKILENKKDLPMTGNPKGDVTLVEFFDYNCGYCRKALEEIKTVLKDEKNLKVIFMDMPILGPQSLEAAKWSLAAHKQGKYFEYHQALLEHNGPKNEKSLKKLAKDVGLDVKKLEKDKDDEDIAKLLNDNIRQAKSIGITGTPGFILDGQLYPGFMQATQIQSYIDEARKK